MSTKTKQKKKTADPLQSTGSTDEYETDDFSPSEESDIDNVAAASYNNRRDDYNGGGTPAATMRGGARSSQRGKNSSGKKKKRNSFTNSSANTKGGKKSSIDEVELLSSEKEEEEDDDSYEGDTETYDKKKFNKKGGAKSNNKSEDDTDDNDMEEESTKNNKRGRRALGHINDNKSNTSKSPVNGGGSSEGDGAGDNNTNNDDDSDDDSDPFANLGKRSNKRQKLQNKGSDDDSDSDSDDSDSDDSSMGMGLGRNRSAQLAKRRQKMMATHTYSSSDDDSSDSDDSLSDKKKKKKPPAKKKSALDDSDSSISFLGTQSRKNPSRKTTKSPQKKAAATSNKQPAGNKGKRESSILDTSCEILSSDDDFDLPKTITTTTTAAKRSSPRKQPPAAASATKKPMSQDTERDPSVRKASTKALDEARKAREALKAAQQYKAKEAVLPPIDVDVPSSLTTSRSRTGGRGGIEVVDVDMISSQFHSRPSVPVPVQISYKGPRITLTLRYQNPTTKKESKANIKIKTDQPLAHLVDEFKTQQQSLEITTVKFDGRNLSLKNTPAFYEMEDEDLVDVVVVVKQQNAATAPSFFGGLASRAAQALGVSAPPAAQAVTLATVHVQTKGNQSQKHTFQIKNDAPLSKVVTAYCEKYDLISMRLEHNGRMLDSNKPLSAEGLPNEVQLDAVDLVQGGPSIKLKFRVYGKTNDITTLSIPMKGKFVSIMGRFAQKKNLSISQCKFIFDGETLNPNSTPEGLDLEGDEIIDVRLPESNSSSSSASATGASLAPGRQISIQTNRNRNTSSRQKSWKVHNTNSISKLQTDYIKYYKSKGCQTVKFYFRNAAINNMTQSFRDLGVSEGDTVYAMENGKPYS